MTFIFKNGFYNILFPFFFWREYPFHLYKLEQLEKYTHEIFCIFFSQVLQRLNSHNEGFKFEH